MRFGIVLGLMCLFSCSRSDGVAAPDVFGEVNKTTPVASVGATSIAAEFRDNALAADTKYANKVVEVEGKFMLAQKEASDAGERWFASLDGGETKGLGVNMFVRCYFDSADQATRARFSTLKNGETIRVKGRVSAQPFEVRLAGCMLL